MNTPIEDLFALAEEAIAPVIWTEKKALQKFKESATPERLREVAEAFRALEQRAEAAEAKLAELAKQEPVLFRDSQGCFVSKGKGERLIESGEYATPYYLRPAPAVSLAELVPDEMTWNEAHSLLNVNTCGEDRFAAFMMGANYNRSQTLRNIEEAK